MDIRHLRASHRNQCHQCLALFSWLPVQQRHARDSRDSLCSLQSSVLAVQAFRSALPLATLSARKCSATDWGQERHTATPESGSSRGTQGVFQRHQWLVVLYDASVYLGSSSGSSGGSCKWSGSGEGSMVW